MSDLHGAPRIGTVFATFARAAVAGGGLTVATRTMHTVPNASIPQLIGRLTDDSKRLAGNEIRLAKLEIGESAHEASRGALQLSIGFGLGVLALVGLTVLLTVVIGIDIFGRAWPGALITGGIEIVVGAWLLWHGTRGLKRADYTLGDTRASLRATARGLADDL